VRSVSARPLRYNAARPVSQARKNALALAAVSTAMMALFWAPAFVHVAWNAGDPSLTWRVHATGYGDWQWFHHMWEAGRTAIVRWGEAPVFDPHHCGGVPLWGNPQAQVFSPTWALFALPFGTAVGHKLYLVAHAIVGHAGFYVLARRLWGFSQSAAFLSATVWAASGFFAWHGAGGHSTFISFYWAPWLLFAWRRSEVDLRHAGWVALLMAVTVVEGGHYPFPYFVLWLGFDLVLRLVDRPRDAWAILRGAMTSAGLAVLLCAFRIVPILITVLAHPHEVVDHDAISADEILFMLTSASGPTSGWPHRWVWNEYGGFVGWGVVGLAAIGALVALAGFFRRRLGLPSRIREPLFLLLGATFFFLLTQGAATEHHPWPLLQELPFYRSIHVPSRFRVLLTFYLAALAGIAFDALALGLSRVRLPRPLSGLREAMPLLVLLGVLTNLYAVNLGINDRWDGPLLHTSEIEPRFRHLRERYGYLNSYADYPWRHVGTRECYDPIPWVLSPRLWLGEGLHARIDDAATGRVLDADRTSRTIWADVETAGPATIVFNQSTMPGFEASEGEVGQADGLVTVRLERAGSRRVTLRYAPAELPWVLAVSLLGLALTVWVLRGLPRLSRGAG